MEKFFNQLLAQILTYVIFIALMLFTFACLMTGEFPPKKESVKAQYQTLLELKNSAGPLLKAAAEKLRASKADPNSLATGGSAEVNIEEVKAQLMKQSYSSRDMNEILQEQARLKTQLEYVIQQNNEIIKLLNKNQKQ